jgi:hypothetical protein
MNHYDRDDRRNATKLEYRNLMPHSKKGDTFECGNYTEITLVNIAYNILSSAIKRQLMMIAEKINGECQCRFHTNRSTVDQLFVIIQMIEKSYEYSMDLRMLYVDFRQAFDTVNRKRLYEVKQMKI